MKIQNSSSDSAVLTELGRRLARHRLNRNLTQAQLAREAGMAKRTLENIESGRPSQLVNLLRLCRALGLLEAWQQMIPEPPTSPLQQLQNQGRGRQRASGEGTEVATTDTWQWADELGQGDKTP